MPNPYPALDHYGDAALQPKADLVEVRVAADAQNVYILARTSAMTAAADTAVLLLADTGAGSASRAVPFNAGIITSIADVAVLLADGAGKAVDLDNGASSSVSVAANQSGHTNAIEASIPRSLVERADGSLSFAAATGLYDPETGGFKTLAGLNANLSNVAFRSREPVRYIGSTSSRLFRCMRRRSIRSSPPSRRAS